MSSPSSNDKLTVVNTVNVPRGGWSLRVEETGVMLNAGTVGRLKMLVRNHLEANSIPLPPYFDEWVEDTACRNLPNPAKWCETRKPTPELKRPRWGVAQVLRFLKTVIEWGVKKGFSFVPQEEAERRAAICAGCPLNMSVQGCMGCSGVMRLVRSIRGSRSTSQDAQLNVCDACGCELKVKVLLPLEVIDNTGVVYPPHCWQSVDGGASGLVDKPQD